MNSSEDQTSKISANPESVKMAHIMDLPQELLSSIITLLAISSDGAKDWARASATCKAIHTVAGKLNVLRVVNIQNITVTSRCEQHHHINGVLSKCVQAGNPNAEYMLAKAILGGGTMLWKMMLENELTNSSIKCATTLPLSKRRYIVESLKTGSIADLPYILFLSEDDPQTQESYKRLHNLRLVKLFVMQADTQEFVEMFRDLVNFMDFFVDFLYFDSRFRDGLEWIFFSKSWISMLIPDSREMLEELWPWRQVLALLHRNEILMALANVLV